MQVKKRPIGPFKIKSMRKSADEERTPASMEGRHGLSAMAAGASLRACKRWRVHGADRSRTHA